MPYPRPSASRPHLVQRYLRHAQHLVAPPQVVVLHHQPQPLLGGVVHLAGGRARGGGVMGRMLCGVLSGSAVQGQLKQTVD
jgi:hypothetical protein